MEKKNIYLLVVTSVSFFTTLFSKNPYIMAQKDLKVKRLEMPMNQITYEKVGLFFNKSYQDFFSTFQNVFSQNTLKVTSLFVPLYLTGRHIDQRIHQKFYDAESHTNKNQPGKVLKKLIDNRIMALPAVMYSFIGVTQKDPREREIARIYGTGLLLTWISKVILKQVNCSASLRPKNELFNKNKNYYGGNPSGHTSMSMFSAVYLGLTKGPQWAIPIGLYAGFVGSVSVALNRHFASQVIAGAALGSIVGVASYATFQKSKFFKGWDLAFTTDFNKNYGVKLSFDF